MRIRRTYLSRSRFEPASSAVQLTLWFGLGVAFALGLFACPVACAQAPPIEVRIVLPADGQVDVAQLQMVAAAPAEDFQGRSETAQRWVRGFIQNELHLIGKVCQPSPEAAQQLVDLAETDWNRRLTSAIRTYAEAQHQRMNTDFDTRVERLMQIWVRDILPEDQRQRWQSEMDARLEYRKRIVIGRMVEDTERKYGLTFDQMQQVTERINERWKDSWWSMYRSGTLPETKFAWISNALSESQRTIGTDRTATQMGESLISGGFVDMPTLDLMERFRIGSITSSPSIPLRSKDSSDEPQAEGGLPLDRRGPLILDPRLPDERSR